MKRIKEKWASLNGRLMACLFLSIVGMVCIAGSSFANSWSKATEDAQQSFISTGQAMQEELMQMFEGINNVAQLAGYSSSVQNYLLSDDPEEVIHGLSPALNFLSDVLELSPDCVNVCFYSKNGRYLYANPTFTVPFREILQKRGFDRDVTMSSSFFVRVSDEISPNYMFYMAPVLSMANPSDRNVIIVGVLCDMSGISWESFSGSNTEESEATVLTYSGSVVASTRQLLPAEEAMLKTIPLGHGSVTNAGIKYQTNRISAPAEYWDFIYFISERTVMARAFASINGGFYLLCAMCAILSVFLFLLVRSIDRNIQQIVGDIQVLNFDQLAEQPRGIRQPQMAELRTIANAINGMITRLHTSFQKEQKTQSRLYEAQHAQARAEMMGYRSQINPHFLFNTLECMRSMAHEKGKSDMETLISSMALMFRYSLYSQPLVPFSQELSHVCNYCNVISIRFPGRYTFKVSAGAEVQSHQTLSMVLQPIVENSIVHAFVGRSSNCIVSISASLNQKGRLIVRIADNGQGMSPIELRSLDRRMRYGEGEPLEGRSSIGLHNIFQRMKLTFGEHFHIRFRSKKGHYTVVELVIPPSAEIPLSQKSNGERSSYVPHSSSR